MPLFSLLRMLRKIAFFIRVFCLVFCFVMQQEKECDIIYFIGYRWEEDCVYEKL